MLRCTRESRRPPTSTLHLQQEQSCPPGPWPPHCHTHFVRISEHMPHPPASSILILSPPPSRLQRPHCGLLSSVMCVCTVSPALCRRFDQIQEEPLGPRVPTGTGTMVPVLENGTECRRCEMSARPLCETGCFSSKKHVALLAVGPHVSGPYRGRALPDPWSDWPR